MVVTRKSTYSNKTHSVEVPITEEELTHFEMSGYPPKGLKANYVRYLTNGTTDDEWNQMLDELDQEDDADPDRRYHR